MAGGVGSRISSIATNIPKPMIKIDGKPVLEHEIECLKENGFTDIIITVSYLKEAIIDYFKDGKDIGVNIEYFVEDEPLGNAGALYEIKDKLSDDFLLLNADSIFDVDLNKFVKYHKEKHALATIMVHPTTHPEDCGLVFVNEDNFVTKWLTKEDKRPDYYRNKVNAGLHILNKKILADRPKTEKVDLDRQILKPLANKKSLYAYESTEYFKDMGTPERYEAVCKDYKAGIIKKKNIKHKQKAIFIYINNQNDNNLELFNEMVDAIQLINKSNYLVFGIADKKEIQENECSQFDTMLSKKGVYFDNIYLLNDSYDNAETNEILKICNKHNVDLSFCYLIKEYKIDNRTNMKNNYKIELINYNNNSQNNKYINIIDAVKGIVKYI